LPFHSFSLFYVEPFFSIRTYSQKNPIVDTSQDEPEEF